MAWSLSKIFTAYVTDVLNRTTPMDLNSDSPLNVSLWNNSITPDNTAISSLTAYGAGVWATGANQISDTGSPGTGWPAAGRPLASITSAFASALYTFDAADTASANNTTTLAPTFGCLIYDGNAGLTVASQGICYNFFGGSNNVTSGSFTIVWNASGIFTIQC